GAVLRDYEYWWPELRRMRLSGIEKNETGNTVAGNEESTTEDNESR
ncbi:hypothetical protein L195_g055797, partial [Trifolium pratense]